MNKYGGFTMRRIKLPFGWDLQRPLMLHLMARTVGGEMMFRDTADHAFFESVAARYSSETGVEVCAYATNGNHHHDLAYGKVEEVSEFMHLLQTSLAKHQLAKYGHDGRVFFRPYLGVPKLQPDAILDCSAYVQANAFKDGWASSLFEARGSSLRAFVGLDPAPEFLKCDRILNLLSLDSAAACRLYKAYVIRWASRYPKILERMSAMAGFANGPNLKYPDRAASLISLAQVLLVSLQDEARLRQVPAWWLVAKILRSEERLQMAEIGALVGRHPKAVERVLRIFPGELSSPGNIVSVRRSGTGRAGG